MNLTRQRRQLQAWIHRPAGILAVLCLLVAVVLAGVPRTFAHAHAHGDQPHAAFDGSHDHDHDSHDDDAQPDGAKPDGAAVVHVHDACVTASALLELPATSLANLAPMAPPAWFQQPPPALSRPSPPYRPPIA